jgi:hypothetical protein
LDATLQVADVTRTNANSNTRIAGRKPNGDSSASGADRLEPDGHTEQRSDDDISERRRPAPAREAAADPASRRHPAGPRNIDDAGPSALATRTRELSSVTWSGGAVRPRRRNGASTGVFVVGDRV